MNRGQLFSMDFIVSTVLVLIAIGATLQALEMQERRLAFDTQIANGTARAFVDALVSGTATAATCQTPGCCLDYSNGTSTCASLSCPKHILAASRLTLCSGTPCRVEVRACA